MPFELRIALFILLTIASACGSDWPQYRGANHDGISQDRITTDWSGANTTPLWRVSLGQAFSSFVVSQGKALTQVYRNNKEVCVALSITNGAELWARNLENGANYGGYDGPRTTPSVVSDSVYLLTSNLKLFRLNLANGAVVWSNNLVAAYSASTIGWANGASALVDNGLIYVNLNTGNNALAAFWTTNGAPAWRVQSERATHATPIAATLYGVRQIIFPAQSGLVSLNATNGHKLWSYPYPNGYNGTCLAASPVVWSNIVFISQSYNPNSTAARIDCVNGAWSANYLWDQPVGMIWMTPIAYKGAVYGATGNSSANDSPLVCLDLFTGETKWSYDGFGRGGVLLVNNLLMGLSEAGELKLIRPTPDAYTELASFQAINSGSCWNTFAVADGKVYARSANEAVAFDFSLPPLKVELSQRLSGNQLGLTVSAIDGSALSSNRLTALELLTTTNLDVPVAGWAKLTNAVHLTNGVIRADNVDTANKPCQFFMVVEPK